MDGHSQHDAPLSSPPSSPLSVLSQSPPPPSPPINMDIAKEVAKRYPSPTSSAVASGSESPKKPLSKSKLAREIQVRTDGPPPPKRRRIAAPTCPRTTTYVDLESRDEEQDRELERLLSALRKKKKVVVIAGAGISVSAGIPDFRSSTGLFKTLRGQHKLKSSGKDLFDASVYSHGTSTESFHTMVRELAHLTSKASPTPFHHMLASIAEEGRLMRLYTQNIDTIETQMPPLATAIPLSMKGPWPTTIQLHGGLDKMVCSKCNQIEDFKASLFEGPEAPECENCKVQDQVRTAFAGKRSHGIGRLRPRMVLYNENNPDAEAIGAVTTADLRRVPDAVIVVGTSLKIPGVRRMVKEMCQLTRDKRDGITAWINVDSEPGAEFKDCWDFVVRGKCDDVAELVGLPRWDQQDIGDPASYMVTGDEQKEKLYDTKVNREKVIVELERKRKIDDAMSDSQDDAQALDTIPNLEPEQRGIPTPSVSPRVRSPLPVSKVAPKGKTKQSTLSFGGSKTIDPPTKPAQKARAPRKPRKSKQDAPLPKNRLTQAFKASKVTVANGGANGKKTPQKQLLADPDSSDLSSPLDLPDIFATSLPSLRPKSSFRAAQPMKAASGMPPSDPFFGSSPPGTPPMGHASLETISPKSKPKALSHLID